MALNGTIETISIYRPEINLDNHERKDCNSKEFELLICSELNHWDQIDLIRSKKYAKIMN